MKKTFIWEAAGRLTRLRNRGDFALQKDRGTVICFDPSLETDNLGDEIIMRYCLRELENLFPEGRFDHIPTHVLPTREEAVLAERTKYKFVCGTNLLTSQIEHHWRWILPEGFRGKRNFRNVILLGCGWGEYQEDCSGYTKMIYRSMLNPSVMHSVRDQYTLEKLRRSGIRNVLNTGCPTTWGLTAEHCRTIPKGKADTVVTTVTDYRPDPTRDQEMLDILSRNYERILLWPQGKGDADYLKKLSLPRNLQILPGNLAAYEEYLARGNVDYVGTRLHGGIHALNHGVRTILVSVDNRAAELGRDIHLPVLDRSRIAGELGQRIRENFETRIRIPQEDIDRFRNQFRR